MNWKNLIAPIGVALVIGTSVYSVNTSRVPEAVLVDAGISVGCDVKVVTCPMKLSESALNRFADAGIQLPRETQRYARVSARAWSCVEEDGGLSLTIPVLASFGVSQSGDPNMQVVERNDCIVSACDELCDAGVPFRLEQSLCVRAITDESDCQRSTGDGGFRHFGAMNVFPASQASGTECERVECAVIAGSRDSEL